MDIEMLSNLKRFTFAEWTIKECIHSIFSLDFVMCDINTRPLPCSLVLNVRSLLFCPSRIVRTSGGGRSFSPLVPFLFGNLEKSYVSFHSNLHTYTYVYLSHLLLICWLEVYEAKKLKFSCVRPCQWWSLFSSHISLNLSLSLSLSLFLYFSLSLSIYLSLFYLSIYIYLSFLVQAHLFHAIGRPRRCCPTSASRSTPSSGASTPSSSRRTGQASLRLVALETYIALKPLKPTLTLRSPGMALRRQSSFSFLLCP